MSRNRNRPVAEAALLASVADPEAAVPNEPVEEQAAALLAATPVEPETPADIEGVMSLLAAENNAITELFSDLSAGVEAAVPDSVARQIEALAEVPAVPAVRPTLSPAFATAAVALDMQGDLCGARDLRLGIRSQELLFRAYTALKSHNAEMAEKFDEEVSDE